MSNDWYDFKAKPDKYDPRQGKPTQLSFDDASAEEGDTGKGPSSRGRQRGLPAAKRREERISEQGKGANSGRQAANEYPVNHRVELPLALRRERNRSLSHRRPESRCR
jgi:hypothetical protein